MSTVLRCSLTLAAGIWHSHSFAGRDAHVPLSQCVVQVLVLFATQFPLMCILRDDDSSEKPSWSSELLTLAWPRPGFWGHLESEPTKERSLSFSLPLK